MSKTPEGMVEDVFNTINHIVKTEERNKIYSEPNFELVPQVSNEWVQEVSTQAKTHPIKPIMASSIDHNSQPHRDQSSY